MRPDPTRTESTGIPVTRTGSNVVARLHALFPSSHPDHDNIHSVPSPSIATSNTMAEPPQRQFLKIRIVSWNMYNSLPRGDLTPLLGSVPSYTLPLDPARQGLPPLPLDPKHPYHLVIVAGQECPSASGMPMAIGAGFKLKDKDKEKEKDKNKDKDAVNPSESNPRLPDRADSHSRDPPHRKHHNDELLHAGHSPVLNHAEFRKHEQPHDLHLHHHSLHHHLGWSSVLDRWFCNSISHRSTRSLPEMVNVHSVEHDGQCSDARSTAGDSGLLRQDPGPYELVMKERMMGLYLAVYAHVEIMHLVQGASKSSVAAGLMGRRVGNKGGVGISLNVNGTTLLLINAHLAAHEGKLHHRISDFAYIKSELTLDDFLDPNDPRVMAEDITDKFDHAFVFGDLNFRLDVTRLHADWLMSRKEYGQALTFDQLRNAMAKGEAFVGFHEAPITFPPTFKYDVVKRSKSKHGTKTPPHDNHGKLLSEIEERDPETLRGAPPADNDGDEEDDDDDDDDDEHDRDTEAVSVTSSTWTSTHSRYTINGDGAHTDVEEEAFSFFSPASKTKSTQIVQKLLTSPAAAKVKEKWAALLPPVIGNAKIVRSTTTRRVVAPRRDRENRRSLPPWRSPSRGRTSRSEREDSAEPPGSVGSGAGASRFAVSHEHDDGSSTSAAEDDSDDMGVYDSSHKQRVPSWCDRILWKSTVEPEPAPEPELMEPPLVQPTRSRMSTLLHALHPPRTRKDSGSSMLTAVLNPMTRTGTGSPLTATPANALSGQPSSPGPHPHPRPSPYPSPRFTRSRDDESVGLVLPAGRAQKAARAARSVESLPDTATATSASTSVGEGEGARARMPRRRSSANLETGRMHVFRRASAESPVSFPGDTSLPPTPTPAPMPLVAQSPSASPLPSPLPPGAPSTPPPSAPATFPLRWRGFIPFLGRDAAPADSPRTSLFASKMSLPRRGDVVCLGYHSLNDHEMRLLEARSDHRPVIGSYAIYL